MVFRFFVSKDMVESAESRLDPLPLGEAPGGENDSTLWRYESGMLARFEIPRCAQSWSSRVSAASGFRLGASFTLTPQWKSPS